MIVVSVYTGQLSFGVIGELLSIKQGRMQIARPMLSKEFSDDIAVKLALGDQLSVSDVIIGYSVNAPIYVCVATIDGVSQYDGAYLLPTGDNPRVGLDSSLFNVLSQTGVDGVEVKSLSQRPMTSDFNTKLTVNVSTEEDVPWQTTFSENLKTTNLSISEMMKTKAKDNALYYEERLKNLPQ